MKDDERRRRLTVPAVVVWQILHKNLLAFFFEIGRAFIKKYNHEYDLEILIYGGPVVADDIIAGQLLKLRRACCMIIWW